MNPVISNDNKGLSNKQRHEARARKETTISRSMAIIALSSVVLLLAVATTGVDAFSVPSMRISSTTSNTNINYQRSNNHRTVVPTTKQVTSNSLYLSKSYSINTNKQQQTVPLPNRMIRHYISLIQFVTKYRTFVVANNIIFQFNNKRKSIVSKTQRLAATAYTVLAITSISFLSTVPIMPIHPAHASSSSTAASISTITEKPLGLVDYWLDNKSSPSLDSIIDKYVQKHMFDDDIANYDPIESTYREAYEDSVTGKHPAAIREITQSILHGIEPGSTAASSNDSIEGTSSSSSLLSKLSTINAGTVLTSTIRFLQNKVGFSEGSAVMVLAGGFVVGVPLSFLFFGMIVGGISKRNMNATMKKRYGDTYTVDATMKKEEIVVAPDDDDDDDDDDEDDTGNDDDDDDDDDDEDDKPKNNKKK